MVVISRNKFRLDFVEMAEKPLRVYDVLLVSPASLLIILMYQINQTTTVNINMLQV